MKKQKLMVQRMAKNVSLMRQDLRSDYPMNYLAEKELSTLVKKVSPQLYGMLVQQLLAFHADMQLEMAEDLVVFTYQSVAHTTGCPSVDMVLDVCYTWIAAEQGIMKPGFLKVKKVKDMMNEIIAREALDNTKYITSIEIAELTGKMHKDVMKAIRNMEPAWESERGRKFALSQIREKISNNGYKFRPCYLLTKTESLFIATKFNDVARARLVIRWENLETAQLSLHAPRQETKLLVTEREILRKGDEIRRVEIERENAPADGCFTMSEIAKDLDTTVKELNKLLVKEGVQYYNGGRYKLNEDYQNSGLAQERSFHYYTLDGEKKERLYLVWTHEGAEFVKEIFCRQ